MSWREILLLGALGVFLASFVWGMFDRRVPFGLITIIFLTLIWIV